MVERIRYEVEREAEIRALAPRLGCSVLDAWWQGLPVLDVRRRLRLTQSEEGEHPVWHRGGWFNDTHSVIVSFPHEDRFTSVALQGRRTRGVPPADLDFLSDGALAWREDGIGKLSLVAAERYHRCVQAPTIAWVEAPGMYVARAEELLLTAANLVGPPVISRT